MSFRVLSTHLTLRSSISAYPYFHGHTPRSSKKTNAAIKLHTLLDIQAQLPVFVRVTAACVHDVRILDELIIEAGAYYILDRAYIDFTRLKKIDDAGAFFVICAKKNLQCHRVYSNPVDKSKGVMSDQTIALRCLLLTEPIPGSLAADSLL